MGYVGNHLATLVTGVFAAILTGLWPYFTDFAPILNFVFIMAVPIMWFLTFTCWISQKSTDYMHNHAPSHTEKKSLSNTQTVETTTTGTQVSLSEIKQIQNELSLELNNVKETVKLKDSEIERLNQEISNLETLVQIESLKTELANLKMLASGKKTK
jgi:conjugal transfer/entry exclusion protein